MKLIRITMTNVRIFKEKVIECHEGINIFNAPNKGGKTTLADAITYVLTGKLYNGSTNPESLKPAYDTKLPVSIELLFGREDGTTAEFKKVYSEKWTRTRGTSDVVFSGHDTENFVNGVKKPLKEYELDLTSFFGCQSIQDIQVMTNAYYFSQTLPWKDRLSYINKIIDPTTPEDVYKAEPITRSIDSMLRGLGYKIPDLRKRLMDTLIVHKAKVQETENMIKGIEVGTNISKQDYSNAIRSKSDSTNKIIELRTKKQGLVNPVLESLKLTRSALQAELQQSINKDNQSLAQTNAGINEAIHVKREAFSTATNKFATKDSEVASYQRERANLIAAEDRDHRLVSTKESELASIREEWHKENNKVFTPSEINRCPQCGFDLEGAEAHNLEEKEKFNIAKANALQSITNRGTRAKLELESLQEQAKSYVFSIANLDEKIKIATEEAQAFRDKAQALQLEINNLKSTISYSVEDSEETATIRRKVSENNAAILKEQSTPVDAAEIDMEIDLLQSNIEELEKQITAYNVQESLLERKKKFEVELDGFINVVAQAESDLTVLQKYIETMLQLITSKLKAKFGDINIRLIEQNIKEGSWNEVCYVMIDTPNGPVPYETANTESKIKVGVKLASLLSTHLGWQKSPIIIDNLEAVTEDNRIFEVSNQVIGLVASSLGGL